MNKREDSKDVAIRNTNEALKILYGEKYRYLISSLNFNVNSLWITFDSEEVSSENIKKLRGVRFCSK